MGFTKIICPCKPTTLTFSTINVVYLENDRLKKKSPKLDIWKSEMESFIPLVA